jgi:hypothetical protein
VEIAGEYSIATFFTTYIGWTGHLETVVEVSGGTFLITFIGWTGHVESVGEVSGVTFSSQIYAVQAMWTQ